MVSVTPHAVAAQRLSELPRRLFDDQDFQTCLRGLADSKTASFDGVWGSTCALLVSALGMGSFSTVVVIAADEKQCDDVQDDLETFRQSPPHRFAALESNSDATIMVDQEYGDRLRILKRFAEGQAPKLVLTSIGALAQPVPSRDDIRQHTRRLTVGDRLDLEPFQRWLLENGFHQTSAVELPGEYSFRGGIIDLFAPDWEQPIRIELFDDEIESLRRFDIGTQRSDERIDEIEITVLSPDFNQTSDFFSYLPEDSLLLVVDPQQVESAARRFVERSQHRAVHSYSHIQSEWSRFAIATASRLAAGIDDNQYRFAVESVESFSGDNDEIRRELDRICGDSEVFVVARVEGEIQRVQEILRETRIAGEGRLNLAVGCVHQGYRWTDQGLTILGCDQLFHRGQLRRGATRRRLGKAIDSFMDLREGNLIVHLAHGIGRYRGLELIEKDGIKTEHLTIEFRGGTRIYVPATKIDLIQKYVGGTRGQPKLAKIGGKAWAKQKQAAESAVSDLAADMLEIQAARASRPGIAFNHDTQWQYEFEQSFPYEETPDQQLAIDAIKHDMQRAQPMDRLLCGDVGFGKTEVAMRAAFKAVENGYQVAVLVPTTILAEQHHRSFIERTAEFPLDIQKLSRFATPSEQRETLAGLKSGRVDIVVGTHRLVSKDVQFNNLGLVIIDEEQRFGVAVKEKLKTLRSSVDVLTMSATPIPRTLHMSLVGVRDISNLETPPEERLAVETRVTRFNNELIRQAILREINRGGQVYFVHNRVNDIHLLKQKLEFIVPEATIQVGHGQMPEQELEQVMTDFIAGRFDVLLATTIVESGLDIPNANTMIIDEADRYGLADLHQLRGRVGRYKHRAYCYLLIDPHKHINPTAAKRLQAIEQFSQMGAGFAISMRDLEIRGTGNLLGTEQSGHIATVGYELYCQMLENAVRVLKQAPARISIHVDIDLPGEAYLPDDYVADHRQKIDLYRRLTRVQSFDEIKQIRSEMRDRFGPLPQVTRRLLTLAELKLEAAVWQVEAIFLEEKYLGFRFGDRSRFEQLVKGSKAKLRIVDESHAYVTLKSADYPSDQLLALAKAILKAK